MYARIIKSITTKMMYVNGVYTEVGELHPLIQTCDKCLDRRFHLVEDYNHLEDKEGYNIVSHLEIIDDKVYYVYEYQEIVEVGDEDANLC